MLFIAKTLINASYKLSPAQNLPNKSFNRVYWNIFLVYRFFYNFIRRQKTNI